MLQKLRPSSQIKINYQTIYCLVICFTLTCFAILPGSANDEALIETPQDNAVENILKDVYAAWNTHDADKVFSFYSSSFMTSDGLSKKEFRELTEGLWKDYPNVEIDNQKMSVRSQDQYATVSVIDLFQGLTKDIHPELGTPGILSAVSQGQIFLRKYGNSWKIESDRTNFELVTVHYGDVKKYLDQHNIFFSAPEQVHSNDQYSATLYFILPENVQATATINRERIMAPQEEVKEAFQLVTEHKLERLFTANDTNHNELLSATIIFSEGILEPKLEGLLFISKRVNVIPLRVKSKERKIAQSSFAAKPVSLKKSEESEED